MQRLHRALNLALAAPLIGTLALAAGCGSSSSSSSSSAAAPVAASTTAPAATEAATTAAPTTAASTAASTAPASSTAAAPGEGTVLKVSADPSGALKFMQMTLTAKPGEVTIDFTNQSSVPHSVAIGEGAATLASTAVVTKSTATTKVELKAGTYTFFCTVPGHEQAGMKGTLTIR